MLVIVQIERCSEGCKAWKKRSVAWSQGNARQSSARTGTCCGLFGQDGLSRSWSIEIQIKMQLTFPSEFATASDNQNLMGSPSEISGLSRDGHYWMAELVRLTMWMHDKGVLQSKDVLCPFCPSGHGGPFLHGNNVISHIHRCGWKCMLSRRVTIHHLCTGMILCSGQMTRTYHATIFVQISQ